MTSIVLPTAGNPAPAGSSSSAAVGGGGTGGAAGGGGQGFIPSVVSGEGKLFRSN